MTKVEFPQEFIENTKSILPPNLTIESLLEISQQPLRKSIRLNTLKAPAGESLQPLLAETNAIPWCPQGYWLTNPPDYQLGNHVSHLNGQFYIQEASSMLPPMALAHLCNQPQLVLDMAAAPGSKTTQIAALMNNSGGLVANELSGSRLKGLFTNIQRCGVRNSALTHFDASVFGAALPQTFDAVLLDAPCSGEGTVRKDPEVMKKWSMASIEELAALQKQLIVSAFHALKPGGVLIYSTCTLNPQENQQVCQHLLEQFSGAVECRSLGNLFAGAERALTPEGYLHIWPQIYDSEGFFIAAFEKTAAVEAPPTSDFRLGQFPYQAMSHNEQSAIETHLQQFGLKAPSDMSWYQRDNVCWLFPKAIEPLIDKVRFNRIGIRVAERHKKDYRLCHEFAIAFGAEASARTVQLNAEQAQQFLQGKDVREVAELPKKGEVLVQFEHQVLGLGKVINQRIKNSLPRDLVRDQPVTQF
ncbi:16S rRNA (cytosine(1407)-C(5))-methyltransferase RsmF [Neiella sp. HB171785]|uniref:16S rRNA (Cytosine(1407)-C(5))-methyltransferase RsmF n=1 Tax=Neiella litorisoli TaxID=2771431 RepID=A0A8J6QHJ7_9GAMM|nr:16S rRNA (cytosine(1407)-C(5))-methyltransferase RsmF [Neiella litorisoli]MBD1388613.1 16S rRNA (cytosine(1407)-C(5))-methyltransferase RsmF [Neiella litorisoli]